MKIDRSDGKYMLSLFVLANNVPSRGDSCPKEKHAAVRCCEMDGTDCYTPKCSLEATSYEDAENECYEQGLRLCTPSEMKSGLCCGSGCEFDNKLTWQGKYNELL